MAWPISFMVIVASYSRIFYELDHASNFMMHFLLEDIYAWHKKVADAGPAGKYETDVSEVMKQPWGMLDFTFSDPTGVLWRFGQNV